MLNLSVKLFWTVNLNKEPTSFHGFERHVTSQAYRANPNQAQNLLCLVQNLIITFDFIIFTHVGHMLSSR